MTKTQTLWTFLDRSTFDGDYDPDDHCVRGLTDDPDSVIAELERLYSLIDDEITIDRTENTITVRNGSMDTAFQAEFVFVKVELNELILPDESEFVTD